jgi:hypothetical protein
VNDGIDNTLVLQVDPTDGKARIINDSTFNVAFDSYRVRSATNSLNIGWNSLDDQNIGGADAWLEAAPMPGALSELNPLGSQAVSAGATAAVMTGLFNFATGTQDLMFDFRVPAGSGLPQATVLTGVVEYLPFSLGLDGDFNQDGKVDAADYVVWRKNGANPLPNDGGLTTATARFNLWRANFGNMQMPGGGSFVSSQVPEPSALASIAVLVAGLVFRRQRLIGAFRVRSSLFLFPTR